MAIKHLAIPQDESGFTVELAYLEKWSAGTADDTPLSFLARGQGTDAEAERAYNQNLPVYRRELANLLEDRRFDVVLSPPSSRSDFEPYRKEILARGIARADLTDSFSRTTDDTLRSRSFDQMIDILSYASNHPLEEARSVLIVDDYFVTGRTAAALLSIIRSHGLPADASVTVACPLWVERSR